MDAEYLSGRTRDIISRGLLARMKQKAVTEEQGVAFMLVTEP